MKAILVFVFNVEPDYYDLGGSKFPSYFQGKIYCRGGKRLYKNTYGRFSPGKQQYFSRGKFCYDKNIAIFPVGMGDALGGKLLSDSDCVL